MADLDIQSLPDDPEALKSLLIDLSSQLASKDKLLDQQQQKVAHLQEQIRILLHNRFAASSERRTHPGQQELFDEAEVEAGAQKAFASADDAPVEVAAHSQRRKGRQPLPEHLPRIEVVHDLEADEKVCDCGHDLHHIGDDISEQLEIIPQEIYVQRNVRKKYACRHCEEGVHSARLDSQIIPGSMATPGLLAYIATAKYVDGLPLHRQEQQFARIGVELPRRTLANWMIQAATLLMPVMDLLRTQLRASTVIQMDETRVKVLDAPNQQSYMWVSVAGGHDPPVVCFDYEPTRSGSVPVKLLEDFSGVLVTDGYAGYNLVSQSSVSVHAGCMAHARRKFDEALNAGKQKSGRAQWVLNEIGKLYAIERRIKDLTPDERKRVRQKEAQPIMVKIRSWLDKCLKEVAPRLAVGKAVRYMDREWERLTPYLDDGRIPIDNNRCENAIRPFVIGRKAWLFSQSTKGAQASAALYSIIETAKANQIEPYHYLRHILSAIASGNPDYEALLPFNMKDGALPVRRAG